MARSAGKTGKRKRKSKISELEPPLNPLRTGMPALDSITDVKEMVRGDKKYRVIKTTETDAYDKPPKRRVSSKHR